MVPAVVRLRCLAAAAAIAAVPCGAGRADPGGTPAAAPERAWSDAGQLSFLGATGNTRAVTLGASNVFKASRGAAAVELMAGAMGATSRKVVQAEQYAAMENVRWNFRGRNYVFERAAWDSNRFAGIADRVAATLGVGRDLVRTPAHRFCVELGGGYVDEQRVRAPRVGFASGRVFARYTYTLSPTSAASLNGEYLHDVPHPAGYRINAGAEVTSALSTHLAIKLSSILTYVHEPVAGFGRTDTLTAAALLVNL